MEKVIVVRMYLKTYNKLKRIIYPRKDETCADYFKRVEQWIEVRK